MFEKNINEERRKKMNRIIQEVTATYFEFASDTETYVKILKADKDFWEDYLVNIKVVEDESGNRWCEIDCLPKSAVSNRWTSSASVLSTNSYFCPEIRPCFSTTPRTLTS